MSALSHFQAAAVEVTRNQLARLESVSRSLFDCVADIKGHDRPVEGRIAGTARTRSAAGLDPDRLLSATRTLAAVWLAFAVWFQVDPPGHAGFVQMALILVMASTMMRLSPVTIALPLVVGGLMAGILYIFVMPHLPGYDELGVMLFAGTFGIYYLYSGDIGRIRLRIWPGRRVLAETET